MQLQTRQLTFGAEGHPDRLIKFRIANGKIPNAVEIQKRISLHLGTGIDLPRGVIALQQGFTLRSHQINGHSLASCYRFFSASRMASGAFSGSFKFQTAVSMGQKPSPVRLRMALTWVS